MPVADLRPALKAYLIDDSAIASAVGNTRVYATILPQGTNGPLVPAVVFNVISEITDHHTQGASGLVMVRMQIDAYATTPNEADALSRAIKLRIDGKAGRWTYGGGSPQTEGVNVQGVFAENARTGYEDQPKLHKSSRDYLIWYEER